MITRTSKLFRFYILSVVFLQLMSMTCAAQNPAPSVPQTKSILLTGGTAHLGNGKTIENAAIGFKDGKLTLVADATLIKLQAGAFDTIINVTGKHIYPSFIAMNTTIGINEIELVRSTHDYAETGNMNPSARSIIAYNTDSKVIPTVRSNGVLLAQVVPQGGLISGSSSVVELDAWNWEDAAYKTDEGIHLNYPSLRFYSNPDSKKEDEQKERKTKAMTEMVNFFKDAKAYSAQTNVEEKNLHFESMKGLFDGTKKLYVHCDDVKEIISAVNFCRDFKIKMVLVDGYDAWRVATLLKENNVAVVLPRTHSLPQRDEDDVELPYKMAGILKNAGVDFCLSMGGYWQVRNLGFAAGTAAAYGLSKDAALQAVSLDAAKILGIDKTVGSLEEGKDATLFISSGDALDMLGNNVELAFIRGKQINLDNVQKQLYHKYMTKYKLPE